MTISLTPQESEAYFFNALCNGLSYIQSYGLEVDCKIKDYNAAKARLQKQNPKRTICYEEVFLEVLKGGGKIQIIDHELDGEYNREISLKEVHDRVGKTPIKFLTDMITEMDDATTADIMLQTVFFEDVIFG